MLDKQSVSLWKASVQGAFPYLSSKFMHVLTKFELAKASYFYQQKDRNSYLTRRILCRLLLSQQLNCKPEEIEFKESAEKKPGIAYPYTSLEFNISHSNDQVLIGLSHSPIGVDVEEIKPTFDYTSILNQYFTNREQEAILKQYPKSREAFFWLWTRKEAYLKYTGEGLLGDLQNMPLLFDGIDSSEFNLKSPQLTPGFATSLVYTKKIKVVNFYSFHPDQLLAFDPAFYQVLVPDYR